MKKQMRKITFGEYAGKLLLWTLPLVLIQLICFVIFLATKSSYELAGSGEIITLMIDQIGKSLMLSVFGSLIFDLIEKREKKPT